MINIKNLTKSELNEHLLKLGEPKYRANQIFTWIHRDKIDNFNKMTNISKKLITELNNNFLIDTTMIYKRFESVDGSIKYLIKLYDDNIIESVLLKAEYGFTVCISSQVGCNMGCKFCASTKGGLIRNLTTDELLSQFYLIKKDTGLKISNIVIMGSGEPLNNFDNLIKFFDVINDIDGENLSLRNITLSTSGIVDKIYQLADMKFQITLALSLHASNDDIRNLIMPISKKYKLDEVLKAMSYYYKKTKRRITFEYILIKDINDKLDYAKELSKLLKEEFKNNNVEFNVNLISINKIDNCIFLPPSSKQIINFQNVLKENKINATIRRSQGKDISGSCGQLVNRFVNTEN